MLTAADRCDRLANSDCPHNSSESDAALYPSAMACCACVESEILAAERAARYDEMERCAKISLELLNALKNLHKGEWIANRSTMEAIICATAKQ
jgi:hypothetical protein